MDVLLSIKRSFSADYVEARDKFRADVTAAGATVKSFVNPNPGPRGEELATDTAWFGPRDARAVLVAISGTHGAEGFCGSGCQIDWLASGAAGSLPKGVAVLLVHAINPHGFAWIRRVTEEGCDLNRNYIDFSNALPQNPGYDELADAYVPAELSGPAFEAAEARIRDYREKHGAYAASVARSGGQYTHAGGLFYGGKGPTWARRTLEGIVGENHLADRRIVGVIDYHTGLGPFGYGELICDHTVGSINVRRAKEWWGESVTEPQLGTSASVPKHGLGEIGWERMLGDKVSFVAIEYGTYTPESGRIALRDDHWLHNRGPVDWDAPETRRIKAALRKQFYPDTDEWREMVLWRSRMVMRQGLEALARS
ncbi:MAG: M14 family metallopeptidase [Alphaproteobacteria bacterium]|nr:M14 family metallopeptidase [Alphaproteobacteria bacterium]